MKNNELKIEKLIETIGRDNLLALAKELSDDSKELVKEANKKGVIYRCDNTIIFTADTIGEYNKITDITTIIKYHALSDEKIEFRGNIKEKSGLMAYRINDDVIEDIEKRFTRIKVDIVKKNKAFMDKFFEDYTPTEKSKSKGKKGLWD